MTSILLEDDKIFNMYKQYRALLNNYAKQNKEPVHERTTKMLAGQLTVAHMLDHAVCSIKEDRFPTAKELKKAPRTLLETFSETTD